VPVFLVVLFKCNMRRGEVLTRSLALKEPLCQTEVKAYVSYTLAFCSLSIISFFEKLYKCSTIWCYMNTVHKYAKDRLMCAFVVLTRYLRGGAGNKLGDACTS
jgi:hypothetical protein